MYDKFKCHFWCVVTFKTIKKLVLATSAISETVVFFGEVITVGDDHSPAPHIYLPTHSQITILIKLHMDSSSLQDRERRRDGRRKQIEDQFFLI